MKWVICLILIASSSSSCFAAGRAKEFGWNELRFATLQTPNEKINAARRAKWQKMQEQKVFGKQAQFRGRAKIMSVTRHDDRWLVTAEQGLTDNEELRKDTRAVFPEPVTGTFRAEGLRGIAPPPTRKPRITWISEHQESWRPGQKLMVAGKITSTDWDDKTITVALDLVTTE